MKYSDLDIYLSYSWKQTEQANRLEQILFEQWGIILRRDRKEIGYKDSIEEFMKGLSQSKHIILLLSDDYFKSKNCMNELLRIYNNQGFVPRILPMSVEPKPTIYSADERKEYIIWGGESWNKLNDVVSELAEIKISTFDELSTSHFQPLILDIKKRGNYVFDYFPYQVRIESITDIRLYSRSRINEFQSLGTERPVSMSIETTTTHSFELIWKGFDGLLGEPTEISRFQPFRGVVTYPNHVFILRHLSDSPMLDFIFEVSTEAKKVSIIISDKPTFVPSAPNNHSRYNQ